MTVIEKETMEAVILMARSLDDLNKQIKKHNEILEEVLNVLREKK